MLFFTSLAPYKVNFPATLKCNEAIFAEVCVESPVTPPF